MCEPPRHPRANPQTECGPLGFRSHMGPGPLGLAWVYISWGRGEGVGTIPIKVQKVKFLGYRGGKLIIENQLVSFSCAYWWGYYDPMLVYRRVRCLGSIHYQDPEDCQTTASRPICIHYESNMFGFLMKSNEKPRFCSVQP